MNNKLGIKGIALFNSAGFGEAIISVDGVKQILGTNNIGKTSFISSLKMFYSDSPANEKQEVWGGHEWAKTSRFYFPNKNGSSSWMAFDVATEKHGNVTVIFYRQGSDNNIKRLIVRHPFDRSMFMVDAEKSLARSIAEVKTRLVDLGVDSADIMEVDTPEDWRQVLTGSHPDKRAINLGIIPLVSSEVKAFSAFKKTLIRALTNAGFEAKQLKEAIETAAGITKDSFSFADGGHFEQLQGAKRNMEQATLALAAQPEFEVFHHHLQAYIRSAGEHHGMAMEGASRLRKIASDIELSKATTAERKVAHEQLIQSKQQALEVEKKKLTELNVKAQSLRRELGDNQQKLVDATRALEGSMESRSDSELAARVDELTSELAVSDAYSLAEINGMIAQGEDKLKGLQQELALVQQGKVSIRDWVQTELGESALSAMQQVYARDVLAGAVDMLDCEALTAMLGKAIPDTLSFGPVSVPFVRDRGVTGVLSRTAQFIEHDIAELNAQLHKNRDRRDNLSRLAELRQERDRLASLLKDRRIVAEMTAKAAEDARKAQQAEAIERDATALDEVVTALHQELAMLAAKDFEKELKDMDAQLKTIDSDRKMFDSYCNGYREAGIEFQAGDVVAQFQVAEHAAITELFKDKLIAVNGMKLVAEKVLNGKDGHSALHRLVQMLDLQLNVEQYASVQSDCLEVLTLAVEHAANKLKSSQRTIDTQIVASAQELKTLLTSLGNVAKRVEAMNREIQSVSLSNVKSISITLHKNEAMVSGIENFIKLARDGLDLLEGNVPEDEKERIYQVAIKAFKDGTKYAVSDLYSLHFKVENVTGGTELITDSGKAGSEGTRTMFQILSGVVLTKSMLKPGFERHCALNMLVDESLRLDTANSKELIRFILKSGFTPLLANPGKAINLGVDYEVYAFHKNAADNLSYVRARKPIVSVRQKAVGQDVAEEVLDAVDDVLGIVE